MIRIDSISNNENCLDIVVTWVYEEFIKPTKKSKTIDFDTIYRSFERRIREEIYKTFIAIKN